MVPFGAFSELIPIGGYESNYFCKIHIDDRVNVNGDLLYRVEEGKPRIINDDVSTLCNINQYSNCSGFIGIDNVSYFYNDKFYIMTTQVEGVSDLRETIIYEANSNIGDQREIYRFNTQVVVNEHWIPTTYYFYDNQMIIICDNNIVSLDLVTLDSNKLFEQEQSGIFFSTIYENELYVNVYDFLNAQNTLIQNINLSINLKSGEISEVYSHLEDFGDNQAFY